MEKVIDWFKTYGGYVLSGILAVAGFLIGRQFPRRTDADPERLRQRIDELGGQLVEYKRRLELVGELHEEDRQRLALAEAELAEARAVVDRARTSGDGIDGDLESLRKVRDRLADLAERYGTKVVKDTELE